MFERFTERARQVVVLAQDEARALRAAQLADWRHDGWELLSVVNEGGAVRAILERRRRGASA